MKIIIITAVINSSNLYPIYNTRVIQFERIVNPTRKGWNLILNYLASQKIHLSWLEYAQCQQ